MKAAILANGRLGYPEQILPLVRQAELLIAADGGSRHAQALGLCPHWVVGDLDSLAPAERQALVDAGAEMIQHLPEKDETDLELALLHAIECGATDIVLLGALGGRTDHLLANILLLALPQLAGIRACLVEGMETIFMVRECLRIYGTAGDLLSLIPIGGDSYDIWTEGLRYALCGGTLRLARARGISNVLVAPQAEVRIGQGMLLAVHRGREVVKRWPRWE